MGGSSGTVRIIERDPFGNLRETYDYQVANDAGEVRRMDIGDEAVRQASGEPGIIRMIGADPSPASSSYDSVNNFRLEEQIGLNNQTVGTNEIEQVTALLLEAVPPES